MGQSAAGVIVVVGWAVCRTTRGVVTTEDADFAEKRSGYADGQERLKQHSVERDHANDRTPPPLV